ncbi:MAG: hypothetical protein NFW16_04825 [Candidatus Accumulibacter sp.]|uniref:hypothetical protein n=1 Tax=Accumulibacter sp. TaxID=2053492 RepID=UPI00258F2615|nr:hypothetical protein [Accumulibacter sp.]MCM8621066.1 hypothetical protein [Accumulibacter sp.]
MGTVAGADECRQPAQLKELAHHPDAGTALQGDAKVRRQNQWMQPLHAFQGLHPRRQDHGGRALRNRLAPRLQGASCQAKLGGHLPLRLSRRQARIGHLKRFRPIQARAALHDSATIHDSAAGGGIGRVSGLQSIPAGPSNIFPLPRLVRTPRVRNFEGSATLPHGFHHAQHSALAGMMIQA